MNKTTGIATAAGVALALGASLFAAVPANAVTAAPTSANAVSESIAPVGPTTSWRGVSINKSVVEGDEIVVAGRITGHALVNGVRAAAGDGYKTVAPVSAKGEFEIRVPSRGDFDTQDYVLQFGRKLGSSVMPTATSVNNFSWYAVRV